MKGIYITLSDVQIIRGCSETQASKIKTTYLAILNLKRRNLTIKEFCMMEEIPEQIFHESIKNYYEKIKSHVKC